MTIRTRFAPSPTGYLHVGGARTALFSWLYAKKSKGQFILRIEDTDRERSTKASVQAILDGMAWLGLKEDEGPFYQTQRFDRYNEVIDDLLAKGLAYRCYCSHARLDALREDAMKNKEKPRYDGYCRNQNGDESKPHVIRFKNPLDGVVIVDDLIRGKIPFQNNELDDLIIRRTDGTPTYNLTVVVDDADMQMTHIIRGDDHLNNTPRQINILAAMGKTPPKYAHLPMILGDDGARLSKRHGAVSVLQYKEEGYLPEALLNYLVRLGWSHGDQEIFSLREMISLFDIKDVNKSPSAFNTEKCLWLNQQYINQADPAYLAELMPDFYRKIGVDSSQGADLIEVIKAHQDRAKTLVEMAEITAYVYQDYTDFNEKAAKKNLRPVAKTPLIAIQKALNALTEWNVDTIHQAIIETAAQLEVKMGKIGQPLRVATVGCAMSPSIDITLQLIGQKAVYRRINKALEYIKKREENG